MIGRIWRWSVSEAIEVTLYIVWPMFALALIFGIIGWVDNRGGEYDDGDA